MADLSQLSDEQLQVYKDLLQNKQQNSTPPSMKAYGGMPKVGPPPKPTGLTKPEDQPYNFFNPPAGLIRTGLNQAKEGATAIASGRKAAGASDIIEGLGKASLPAAIPFALPYIGEPAAALGTTILGTGLNKGGEFIADKLGASPDESRLTGDIAGALPIGGLVSPKFRGAVSGAVKGGVKEAYSSNPETGGFISRLFRGVPFGSTMAGAELGKYGGRAVGSIFGAPQIGEEAGTVLGAVSPAVRGAYRGALEGWRGPQPPPAPDLGEVKVPELSEGEMKSAVKSGAMSMDDFAARLQQKGYSPGDIKIKLDTLQPKTVSPFKIDYQSKVNPMKSMSAAKMEQAVINGAATMDDYKNLLTRNRIIPEDVDTLTNLLQQKIDAMKAADGESGGEIGEPVNTPKTKENNGELSNRQIDRPIVKYTPELQPHEVTQLQQTARTVKENSLAQWMVSSNHDLDAKPTAELLKSVGKASGLKYDPSLRTYENAVTKARLLKKGQENAPQSPNN